LGCWTSRRVRRLAYETHRCTNITSAVMGTHSQTNTNAQFSIWVSSLLHFLPECTGRTVPSLLRMAWAKARLCIWIWALPKCNVAHVTYLYLIFLSGDDNKVYVIEIWSGVNVSLHVLCKSL
jgi:hypothetical protein